MIFTEAEIARRTCKETTAVIDLYEVDLLPQVRGEAPEEIDVTDLKPSIVSSGMFNTPMVAVYNQEGLREYIELTNILHGSNLSVSDFPLNSEGLRYVLDYGHRRWVACKEIHANFPQNCIRECGTPAGREFLRRLKKGKIRANLIANPPAKLAKKMQLEENTYRGVEPYKEARIIGELFKLEKVYNPAISVAEFARGFEGELGVGRIRDALRFYELPKLIQEATFDESIKYGHAVQIGRYLNEVVAEDPEDKAKELLSRVINYRPTVPEFSAWVSERIKWHKGLGAQLDMAELMGAAMSVSERVKFQNRDGTAKTLEETMLRVRGYKFLFEKGILTLETSPLREEENAKKLSQVIKQMETALNQFEKLVELLKDPSIPHLRRLTLMSEAITAGKTEKAIRIGGKLAARLEEGLEPPN